MSLVSILTIVILGPNKSKLTYWEVSSMGKQNFYAFEL